MANSLAVICDGEEKAEQQGKTKQQSLKQKKN